MPKADPARRIAWEVMRAVDTRDAYVNLLLPGKITDAGLGGRDAAFATELTHGTIRRQGTYDAVLETVTTKGLAAVDPPVRDVLRLGTHQLLSLRTPSHAAVSTSVDLVREQVGHKPAAFVNAVLRKVARNDLDAWMRRVAPSRDADPIGHLSVVYSHPRWIVEALRAALGDDADALERLLEADNDAPHVTLAARPGLTDTDRAELEAAGATPGSMSPYAYQLPSGMPGGLSAVRGGRVGVQDEGSQLVAIAAAAAPLDGDDAAWLDLCAGPGGKAALLGALAGERSATVTANELQPHRAELVRKAVRGLDNVTVVSGDGRKPAWEGASFDRVLVDAPCTGLGALRRRPEARWRRSEADLDSLTTLQRELLGSALDSTRRGGIVTYATCSPHVRETQEIVEAIVARRDDVEVVDATRLLPQVVDLSGPYVQLWPHVHGTDAMFVAVLRRR
ncbi:RsmB/NOP family class I SAM-dependent RNA methyltransferase [Solicola gregarius]|uniref:rRNA cytosine-C5-methyltransferase n=1 Tax=Solicola gregarius TaxID=2908642 RepID=A0AA46THF7_9ACTN|nr:transcription antitermination factor NusB [Solicola gregarius]UYM05238.1 rRNA cytosine-C5-methyltransferase [Solicola gregarius]